MNAVQEITRRVYQEARLLDERALDEWLTLFTSDATYWVPMDEKQDPRTASSIMYDDRRRMEVRVEQAMRQRRPAQSPPSCTVHFLSNIEVDVNDAAADVDASLLCCELRAGDWRQEGMGDKQWFVGRVHYRLRLEAGSWKFSEKRIVLIDRHQPIEALSFIL
jgi:3-phenylpropionate/cinnamic acid dioxygenase small subunit